MSPTHILLVDDSSYDALLIESLLHEDQSFPHSLTRVERLAEALALAKSRTFDVALSDLQLPDSAGLATLQALHQNAPEMAIIVLTRQGDMETGRAAIQSGAQDFLPKSELTTLLAVRAILYAIERKRVDLEREKLIAQLQNALAEVKTLSGLLPICAHCKKVRDDAGYWKQIDIYISQHTDASISHGVCPECAVHWLEEGGVNVPPELREAAKTQTEHQQIRGRA
jgi:DNA-binding NtrC family response regulator